MRKQFSIKTCSSHTRRGNMRTFIILAAFAVSCLAAPQATTKDTDTTKDAEHILQRPSPINPDIPMEPKPNEKITLIADPKEITDIPTISPEFRLSQHVPMQRKFPPPHANRDKRDLLKETGNNEHKADYKQTSDNKKPIQKRVSTAGNPKATPPSVPKRLYQSRTTVTPKKIDIAKPNEPAKHEIVKHRQKRDEPSSTTAEPLKSEHKIEKTATHVPEIVSSSTSLPLNAPGTEKLEHKHSEQEPQILPATISTSTSSPTTNEPHTDAIEHKHSPQEPQVRPQILPAFLPVGAEVNPHAFQAVLAVKRDIPVPLVPKHHHPEESPKDDADDKKISEEKKSEQNPVEEKKTVEKKANGEVELHPIKRDDVQVEDLSNSVPLQHPKPISLEQHKTQQSSENQAQHHNIHQSFVHHEQQEQHHFQPQHPHVANHHDNVAAQQKETNSATDSTSTTTSTEHPVLRHKPVPAAELFARPHQQI